MEDEYGTAEYKKGKNNKLIIEMTDHEQYHILHDKIHHYIEDAMTITHKRARKKLLAILNAIQADIHKSNADHTHCHH